MRRVGLFILLLVKPLRRAHFTFQGTLFYVSSSALFMLGSNLAALLVRRTLRAGLSSQGHFAFAAQYASPLLSPSISLYFFLAMCNVLFLFYHHTPAAR